MKKIHFSSITDQVVSHLRDRILQGTWNDALPGRDQLARELGVSGNTMEAALRQLQKAGLIRSGGPGHKRKVNLEGQTLKPGKLQLIIQHYEPADLQQQNLLKLQYQLRELGHAARFAPKSLVELGMKRERVARQVKESTGDAWIIESGSREVLEWFAHQDTPAFAVYGRHRGLPMAAAIPDKGPVVAAATRHLVQLGHTRIIMLARRDRREPVMGSSERVFLETLAKSGITPGPFNMPDWEETASGLHSRLESMFRITRPTAIIVQNPDMLYAVMQFLMTKRLSVPEDVSLICTNPSPDYHWFHRPISHIAWEANDVLKRALKWAGNVAHGKPDTQQTLTRAHFVEGGTIGPAPCG